jgi:tetratricopeptide (TPR) repeat protein
MSDPSPSVRPAALGDLERVPLPSLFYSLYKKRFTGHVELREGGQATTVYFREGTPVAALLPTQTEHLGRVLLETGVIDQATWEESMRRMTETGQRHGEILKQMGKITDEQLTAGLKLQLRRKLTGLFGIDKANFEVYALDHQFGRAEELSQMRVHPRRIVYQGIRALYTDERLDHDARDLEQYATRVTAEAAGSLDKYGFEDQDRPVVEALQRGYHTIASLCAATGCERTRARQIVYSLWVTEALEFADPATLTTAPAAAAAPAPAASGAAAPAAPPGSRSALVAPITSSTLPPLRPRLKPPLAPVPTPPPATATAAAASVARPPTPLATPAVAEPPRARVPTPAAAARVTDERPVTPATAKPGEAQGVTALVGQKLRSEVEARYNQIEKQNLFQVLGLDEHASKDQVRAAYLELAKIFHPDRAPGAGGGELRPKMERIFARISEAHATLLDDQARKKYEQTVRDGAKGDSNKGMRILEAEIAYQKGTVFLRRKDWLPALAELRRAVSLNADEAEHHALLAWALWQGNADKVKAAVEAKPMLQKAVSLQPRCHHAHFYMGEILMSENALPQALACYQRVLALDPDNVDAQRAVRLINLRLEKETKKGGLFDRFRRK